MSQAPKYQPGDRVRVRVDSPSHHFRTPSYIQGKTGRVVTACGAFLNPESLAHGGTGLPEQRLYRVEFVQTEVWDRYQGPGSDKILVDIYEHWLNPVSPQ
jgi:nitrile hydratase